MWIYHRLIKNSKEININSLKQILELQNVGKINMYTISIIFFSNDKIIK